MAEIPEGERLQERGWQVKDAIQDHDDWRPSTSRGLCKAYPDFGDAKNSSN